MTRPAFLTIGLAGAALAATGVVLWAAYGEAVFVDILLSGIAGCFG
jgi:cytochrome b subunit of formate dehydrogenase